MSKRQHKTTDERADATAARLARTAADPWPAHPQRPSQDFRVPRFAPAYLYQRREGSAGQVPAHAILMPYEPSPRRVDGSYAQRSGSVPPTDAMACPGIGFADGAYGFGESRCGALADAAVQAMRSRVRQPEDRD
jgi:hypothetical protein